MVEVVELAIVIDRVIAVTIGLALIDVQLFLLVTVKATVALTLM